MEYIKEQDPDFIRKLGAPSFKGSLLNDTSKDEDKSDRKSDIRSQLSSLKAKIRNQEHDYSHNMRGASNNARPSTQ